MERVHKRVASHRSVFEAKPPDEQEQAKARSEEEGKTLAFQGRHCVTCPACGAVATVQGQAFGKEHMTEEDGEVVVRQAVSPASLSCSACELKLEGYAELEACDLGGQYTRRTSYTPEEYYGLIHPDDLPEHIEEYLAGQMDEYDNE